MKSREEANTDNSRAHEKRLAAGYIHQNFIAKSLTSDRVIKGNWSGSSSQKLNHLEA